MNRRAPYIVRACHYKELEDLIPKRNLIAQLYNLEFQFAPSIAFLDGLDSKNPDEKNLELIRGFERDREHTTAIVAEFSSDETSRGIYRRLMGSYPESRISIAIGYNEVSDYDVEEFRRLAGGRNAYYFESTIVDWNHRENGSGRRLVGPAIRRIDDENGCSVLTTWIRNYLSYQSPAGFWSRLGFEPLVIGNSNDLRNAEELTEVMRRFQENRCVTGRNYNIEQRTVGQIRSELGQNTFSNYGEDTRIAVLREYYPPLGYNGRRWDGIIMTRNWEINRQDR